MKDIPLIVSLALFSVVVSVIGNLLLPSEYIAKIYDLVGRDEALNQQLVQILLVVLEVSITAYIALIVYRLSNHRERRIIKEINEIGKVEYEEIENYRYEEAA